jgi:hypothetical protein
LKSVKERNEKREKLSGQTERINGRKIMGK